MSFHHLRRANCGGGIEVVPETTEKLKVVVPKAKVVEEDETQTTTDAMDSTCPLCEAPDFGECGCDRKAVLDKLWELGRKVPEAKEPATA